KALVSTIMLFLLTILGSYQMNGQDQKKHSRRAEKMYIEATEAYQLVELNTCLTLSGKLLEKYPLFPKAWLLLGQCADDMRNQALALKGYCKFLELDSISFPEVLLRIAELNIQQGQYLTANKALLRYQNLPHITSDLFERKMIHLDQQISFAIKELSEYSGDPPVVKISAVNSMNEEYFPSLTVDGKMLVFTRQEVDSTESGNKPKQEDLFSAVLGPNGFENVRKLPAPLNTNHNEGTQTIRQDGRLMFFTSCNRPDSKGGCDLYSSYRINNEWSRPVNIGYPVNTRYWESTPCLTPDGRSLFFATNRPGGFGGMDIWTSQFSSDGGWQEPENLGPNINTNEDEMSPFIHGDGISLYFSSSGWVGMGGMDIFLSRMNDSLIWTLPVNLGYPINTFADDFGLTTDGNGLVGYFSSSRDSTMNRDIYTAEFPEDLKPQSIGYVSGKVIDSKTKQSIGAWVKVTSPFGKVLQNVEADPVSGEYLVGLPIKHSAIFVVSQPGYLYYSSPVPIDSIRANESFTWNIHLDPVEQGQKKILEHLFFSFDSAVISPDSESEILELYKLMTSNIGLQIEISGHTDSLGSDEYNISLSYERAAALKKRLVMMGVLESRIAAFGAGSSQPIAENNTADGRATNRRTEIRIIKSN
ncbi:MAG: OmpA family protein, partial [Bacteroidetes bacterium]|nr:OmpA family protein [Bacteroidota bacterium]